MIASPVRCQHGVINAYEILCESDDDRFAPLPEIGDQCHVCFPGPRRVLGVARNGD